MKQVNSYYFCKVNHMLVCFQVYHVQGSEDG